MQHLTYLNYLRSSSAQFNSIYSQNLINRTNLTYICNLSILY